MIKAVIFDYDGVIVDSIGVLYKITQKIARIFGGKPFRDFEDFRERFIDWREFYQSLNPSSASIIEEAEEVFYKEFHKARKDIKLYDGMFDVIVKLSEKYKLGISSHSSRRNIEAVLRENKLLKYFDSIASGDSKGKLKPHPNHLRICMRELEVKPSETCEVGDALWDIKAAKAARVAKIIAVTYGVSTESKLSGADVIVHRPEEILKALDGA